MNISQDFISLLSIGGTDMSAPDTIRADIRDSLWWRYLESRVPVQMKAGVRRFMVWAPGGYERGKPINFTRRFGSAELGDAVREYIKSGAEVIVYLGQMPRDPVLSKAGPAMWLNRAIDNVCALTEQGCSIAFDDVDDLVSMADRHELLISLLDSLGVRVYVEPRIQASKPSMLHDLRSITVAFYLERFPKEYHPGCPEHIALLTGRPPASFGWGELTVRAGDHWNKAIPPWSRRQRAEGRTVCFNVNDSLRAKGADGIRAFLEGC